MNQGQASKMIRYKNLQSKSNSVSVDRAVFDPIVLRKTIPSATDSFACQFS